jgi:hypothetical protein
MCDELVKRVKYTTAYNGAVKEFNDKFPSGQLPDRKEDLVERIRLAEKAANDAIANIVYPNPLIVFGAHGKSGNRVPKSGLPE